MTTAEPTVRVTARWHVHVLLAGTGLVSALLLRAPLVALLVAPSALLLAAALTWRPGPAPGIRLAIDRQRLLTDDGAEAVAEVDAGGRGPVALRMVVSGQVVPGAPVGATVTPAGGDTVRLAVPLTARRWGAAAVGPVEVRWRSPGGLVEAVAEGGGIHPIRILPHTPPARVLVRPRSTHVAHGAQRSRATGEGTEFADLRPFAPGDRARDVSPLVSARRGAPWVVERHPDRRTDIVLLLDAYDPAELDDVLSAARSLARGHLQDRDRVGVTTMTGVLRWLPPGDGPRHEHRIAEALVDARVAHSWVRPAVEELPPRVLPPGALVLGVTPGTDPRLAEVAIALRARGRDVAVLVLDPPPVATVAPEVAVGADGADRVAAGDPVVDDAAARLLALQRRAVRDRLHLHGVAAVAWDPATPVDAALADLRAWRRRTRRRRS